MTAHYQRQRFDISVSGGLSSGDTGPNTMGEIQQLRWVHPADTGAVAALQIAALPDENDTGLGWLIYNGAATSLGTQFTKAIRQQQHGVDGVADTGETGVPVVLAGERLRVKVAPADTGVVLSGARLYIWVKN